MRVTRRLTSAAVLAVGLLLSAGAVQAQSNPTHNHILHILSGFPQTPGGEGLLPTALAEANVAVQHARLAGADPDNLGAMKLHTTHVLHAVDPRIQAQGPGLGYGVKWAAVGVADHIEFATLSDRASDSLLLHAVHVATSARNVARRADQIAELAARIAAAETAAVAAALVDEMRVLAEQLVSGRDANGDGTISWQEGEGGLDHVQQHMGFIAAGEGLD